MFADYAGDVEIIDSTVRDCSAVYVRRVELAASSSATRQRGDRWRGPRLPHPALSSQPQAGGVVFARDSGAVSIIGSAVTGCSATGEYGVRRVELAALQQRRPAAGREMEGPRLPHPALSSQPQTGGVVYAYDNSGAVSIIGSTVSGCSATVRRVELAASSSAARQRGER